MSATQRRRRQRANVNAGTTGSPAQGQSGENPVFRPITTPLPQWRWRTFPVLFALTLGLFLGVWGGVLAGYEAGANNNNGPMNIVFIVVALLLGGTLSRLATRFMLSREWIKPKAKPAAKKK